MEGLAVISRDIKFTVRIEATTDAHITAHGEYPLYQAFITLDNRVHAVIPFSAVHVGGALLENSYNYDSLDIQLLARFKRVTRISKTLKPLALSLQSGKNQTRKFSGYFKPSMGRKY